MNDPQQSPFVIAGVGEITPPAGLTLDDMDRLAREADQQRHNPPTPKD